MEERFTEEELRLMINNDKLFDKYDLGNMYSVCDKSNDRLCPDCGLAYTEENKHLFYTYKCTRCRACCKIYSKKWSQQHKEKRRLHSKRYRERLRLLNNIEL